MFCVELSFGILFGVDWQIPFDPNTGGHVAENEYFGAARMHVKNEALL